MATTKEIAVGAGGTTVIGQTITVNGKLSGEEDLTVRGRLEGEVTLTKTLILESTGIVKANVSVKNAIISGVVVGNGEPPRAWSSPRRAGWLETSRRHGSSSWTVRAFEAESRWAKPPPAGLPGSALLARRESPRVPPHPRARRLLRARRRGVPMPDPR
jgi:hypothetical protein